MLPKEKLAYLVYQIPCQCDKVYVGETQRRLETQGKEYRDGCNKGDTWKSAMHSRASVEPAMPSGLGRNQEGAR